MNLPSFLEEPIPAKNDWWTVDDDKSAEYALSIATTALTHLSSLEELRDAAIADVNRRFELTAKKYKDAIKSAEESVEPYMKKQIYAQKKSKSYALLSGVASTKKSTKMIVDDLEKLKKWVEEKHPTWAVTVTTVTIDNAKVKSFLVDNDKAATKDTSVKLLKIPGCHLQVEENFKVKLNLPELT